jgi:hypothetical protein
MMATNSECRCESNHTCDYCLRNAPPAMFTPSDTRYYFSRMNDRAIAEDAKKAKVTA